MFDNFLSLIFPKLCVACERSLWLKEEYICTYCQYKLPKTDYHLQENNKVAKLFCGLLNLKACASCYHFTKGGKIKNLIHKLKYKGHKEIGIAIGKQYGIELRQSNLFKNIDLIISLPLHTKKLKTRGYNQSEYFAQGLSMSMNIPFNTNSLIRTKENESQTFNDRVDRFENVKDSFAVVSNKQLEGKHILLVDDVITTGATIESCAGELLKIKNTKVSIATIACA